MSSYPSPRRKQGFPGVFAENYRHALGGNNLGLPKVLIMLVLTLAIMFGSAYMLVTGIAERQIGVIVGGFIGTVLLGFVSWGLILVTFSILRDRTSFFRKGQTYSIDPPTTDETFRRRQEWPQSHAGTSGWYPEQSLPVSGQPGQPNQPTHPGQPTPPGQPTHPDPTQPGPADPDAERRREAQRSRRDDEEGMSLPW